MPLANRTEEGSFNRERSTTILRRRKSTRVKPEKLPRKLWLSIVGLAQIVTLLMRRTLSRGTCVTAVGMMSQNSHH